MFRAINYFLLLLLLVPFYIASCKEDFITAMQLWPMFLGFAMFCIAVSVVVIALHKLGELLLRVIRERYRG